MTMENNCSCSWFMVILFNFSWAICANKCNIKLGHIEAGLRSFDASMPEENNRILTDHLSDYLFAPTTNAVNNLKKERIRGKVYHTGDLSVEIIGKTKSISKKSKILEILNLKSKSYLLLTCIEQEYYSKYPSLTLETFEALKDLYSFDTPKRKRCLKLLGVG